MLKKVITAFLSFYCLNILARRSYSGIDGKTKIAVSAFKESVLHFLFGSVLTLLALQNIECIVEKMQGERGSLMCL